MRRDPTEFRERFAAWKTGEKVYENGLPVYGGGKSTKKGPYVKGVVSKPVYDESDAFYQRMQERQAQLDSPKVLYTRQNNNPVKFDEQGNLVDLVTGETGTMMLPEVRITPKRYDAYHSTFNPDIIRNFTDWLPIVGDIGTGVDIKNAIKNQNYLEASLLGGSLLLPNILKRPIKQIGKFLPHSTQARLIENFPNFFNSEKTTISNLQEEIRDKLYDFYNKDVYPRYTQIQDFNRILRPDEQYILGRGSYINDMPITFVDGFDSKLGGWGGTKNGIFINRKYINASNNPDEKLFSTILHESEHQLRRDMSKKFINPYTHFEDYSLDKAYNFTDDYVKKNKMTPFTHEKGATNRQLRGKLYYDTGLTGSDLDKYIDNMTDKELEDLFTHVNSSYTKNFLKNGINSTNVKRTMKWVPFISIPVIGTAFNNTNYAE